MKNWTIIVITLLVLDATFAQDARLESESYIKATNAQELSRQLDLQNDLRIYVKACAIQITKQVLPEACYKALAIARNHNLQVQLEKTRIDQKCIKIARLTAELVNTITSDMNVECHDVAAKRIEINLYKSGF